MSETFVPTIRTTPSFRGFLEALHEWWPEFTREGAAVIYSQFAVETAKGFHCYNHNLGNVKHVKGDGFDYMALRGVWEIINGKRVEIPPENPGAWFRAYSDLITGMKHHLELIRFKKFKSAWQFVEAGNPAAFAVELRRLGYYTASAETYANLMKIHFDAFLKATEEVFMEDATIVVPQTKPWVGIYLPGEGQYGRQFLVAPEAIGPFTIGEAAETARYFGWQLPFPELEQAIYEAADLKIPFIERSVQNGLLKDWGPSMFSKETIEDHRRRIKDKIQEMNPNFTLMTGATKLVGVQDDIIGIFGGRREDGSMVQPLGPDGKIYSKHALAHGDYSQWLHPVIEVFPFQVVHPSIDFEPKKHEG